MEFDPQSILFHGHGLVGVDKPAGVPVHRGTGHSVGVTDLLGEWVSLNPGLLDVRPGSKIHPVHRLDLEASGALLLAVKTSAARAATKRCRCSKRTRLPPSARQPQLQAPAGR